VDIVALEHMPYFFPEHVAAAIAAGKHVYMAKPVAVDVPGTLKIGELGKEATRKNLGFIVDYQMPTDPHNIEVRERILAGDLGKLVYVCSYGVANRWPEAEAKTPREEYLRHSKWIYHTALAANSCVSFDIHSIDTAMWVIGRRPAVATGFSARSRAGAFLDGCDVVQTVLHFDDGLIWTHQHQSLTNQCTLTNEGGLVTKVHGTDASATLTYWGKAMVRGGPKSFARTVENLYPAGIKRNVAQFYADLTGGNFTNPTVARSVESNLAAILIREAAVRGTRLTMDELLKENKKLEFDTTGFKA
jgi:predicted dehydrogenase